MLVKFTLSGLPPTTTAAQATLRLWSKAARSDSSVLTAYAVSPTAWTESTATWNTQPSIGAAVGTESGAPDGGWLAVDVSSAIHGNGSYAFELRATAGTSAFLFADKEDATLDRPAELRVTPLAASPVAWGLYLSGDADVRPAEACPASATSVCRTFGAFRRYQSLSQITGTAPDQTVTWPSSTDDELVDGGRTLFLDVANRCFGSCPATFDGVALPAPVTFGSDAPADFRGEYFDPNDIAAGRLDPILDAAAARLRALAPAPVVLDVGGEIDTQVGWMTDTARKSAWLSGYRAMFRHVHQLFVEDGVTNVVWNYLVGGFAADDGEYTGSYPGDAYVDMISWDPYDTGYTHGSAYAVLDRFYARLQAGLLGPGAMDKPYAIPEYGFGAPCQAVYLTNLVDDLKQLQKTTALIYFDRSDASYTLDTHGWQAYTTTGHDPYVDPETA